MQRLLTISGSRRNTTNGGGGGATEDRNIQCKNITQRRARARTGRRTERKWDVIELGEVRRIEESFTM